MTATTDKGKVNAWDYRDVRHHNDWAPETQDSGVQDLIVRLLEPTGVRGLEPTGTHLFALEFWNRSVRRHMTQQRLTFLKKLDDDRLPWLYDLTHRGFGKTTLAVIAATRRLACRRSRFLLFTSSEYKISARRTNAIRGAFMDKGMRDVFGNTKPVRYQGAATTFSEDAYVLVDPNSRGAFACVSPRGSGQSVNGSIVQLFGNEFVRPDLLVNDDGQSRKNIWNMNVRERYEEWVEAEYFQTVDVDVQPGSDHLWHYDGSSDWRAPWRIWLIDTCKHRQAHLMKVKGRPQWRGDTFPLAREVAKGQFVSATDLMTDEQVQAMYQRMALTPDYWAREFLCVPASKESCYYDEEMFLYYADHDLRRRGGSLVKWLIVDPARVGHHKASRTSILAVAVDVEQGRIYLRKNISEHLDPEDPEYFGAMFRTAIESNTTEIWVEESGLSGVMRNAIKQAASVHGVANRLQFEWLHSTRSPGVDYGSGDDAIKRARAAAMHPYYKQGLVLHEEGLKGGRLERALLEYPECSSWDETDTLGYIPEILERKGILLEGGGPGADFVFDEDEDEEYDECGRYFASGAWLR
jgi:hypothetical protein